MASRFSCGGVYSAAGFTLIELSLVVFLIALLLAISLPRLTPAIALSGLEGSARHLTGYGRSLRAHAAMTRESMTFKVDFAENEYYTVRWILAEDQFLEQSGEFGFREKDAGNPYAYGTSTDQDQQLQEQADELEQQFRRFTELALKSRARNVPKEDDLFGEMEFENEFDLGMEDNQEEDYEEVKTDLLSRTRLPQGVTFDRVRIGNKSYREGIAEVDLSALGFDNDVTFTLKAGDDYYTVVWDAITGGTRMEPGRDEYIEEEGEEAGL